MEIHKAVVEDLRTQLNDARDESARLHDKLTAFALEVFDKVAELKKEGYTAAAAAEAGAPIDTGPTLGPKARAAIAEYAGLDRSLQRHLELQAMGLVAENVDDEEIAKRIKRGRQP